MRNTRTLIAIIVLLVMMVACNRSGLEPTEQTPDLPSAVKNLDILGIAELGFTIQGPAETPTVTSSLRWLGQEEITKLNLGNANVGSGMEVRPSVVTSFMDGLRPPGGSGVMRITGTFDIRNAAFCNAPPCAPYSTDRSNLTFLAVDTDNTSGFETIGDTAVRNAIRFNGTAADPALASLIKPTHGLQLNAGNLELVPGRESLQAFSSSEVALSNFNLTDTGVVEVLPWGFVVNCTGPNCTLGSRRLPANPGDNQFDGELFASVEVPLQTLANDDVQRFQLILMAVDDDNTRVTEGLNNDTSAEARADALTADTPNPAQIALLGNSTTIPAGNSTIRLCRVNINASGSSTLVNATSGSSCTPVAVDDSYNAIANVGININEADGLILGAGTDDGKGQTITVSEVQGVAANVGNATNTANGGSVTVATDGSFSYTPPTSMTNDSFTYRVSSGGTDSNEATVSLSIDGTVWFIDNSVAGPGTGTQADPFNDFSSLNGAGGAGDSDEPGDYFYVFQGAGAYTQSLELEDNQILLGEAVDLNVMSTVVLTGTGNRPSFSSTAGNGIDLASGNTIRGLDIGNTTGFGIGDSGGTVGNLTISDVAISGNGGLFNTANGGTLAVTFDSLSSTNASNQGIALDGVSGSFTVTGSSSITGSGNAGIDIDNSAAGFSFDAQGMSTIDNSGNSSAGINLSNNGTATFSFAGLDIDTTSGIGLSATSGGTINVTGSTNTIDTTTGTAININASTIGASGITFESVSVGSGGTGPSSGIILNTTGTTAGLSITGTGGACNSPAPTCTGGTIQNTSSHGISLTDSHKNSFSFMNIKNNDGHGIFGLNISELTVDTSNISNNDDSSAALDPADIDGIFITNLSGSDANASRINDSYFADNDESAIHIINNAAVTGELKVEGATTFNNNAEDGIIIDSQAAGGTFTIDVGNASAVGVDETVTFEDNLSGIQLNSTAGTIIAKVRNSFFEENPTANEHTNAISGTASGSGIINAMEISGNDIEIPTGAGTGLGGISFSASGNGSVTGTISNNVIDSPETTVHGIRIKNSGSSSEAANAWSITGNTINLTATGAGATTDGIAIEADSTTGGGIAVTLQNNTIDVAGASGFTAGIELFAGSSGGSQNSTICANFPTPTPSNSVAAPSATLDGNVSAGDADIVVASFTTGTQVKLAGATISNANTTDNTTDTDIFVTNQHAGAGAGRNDVTVFPSPDSNAYVGVGAASCATPTP